MTMTRPKALCLGLLTMWPILYTFVFFAVSCSVVFSSTGDAARIPSLVRFIFPIHLLTMSEIMGLLAVYIVHLFKTDAIPQEKKTLWAVVLFLGNMAAMPVYWYQYIWKPSAARAAD